MASGDRIRERLAPEVNDGMDGGLQAVFLANRPTLLRFLTARGAGEDAEDALHEVWLRISRTRSGPVASPMSYMYRVANTVIIDRFRSASQSRARDHEWADAHSGPLPDMSDHPSPDRTIAARQSARRVAEALATLSPRASAVFRRTRLDGLTQREVAAEFGVSISTIESDLRSAYRVLAEIRERLDED